MKIQCRAYVQYQKRDVAAWKKNLMQSPEAPNKEQEAFLDRVLKRCEEEHAELGRAGVLVTQKDQHLSEPIRDCLLGIPGAGKSHCIKLVRLFFEECLKWEDGVQFQFLAQQNTMAALIGGKTVNSWGVIPINPEAASRQRQGKNKDGDVDELFTNALGIRFLIIDECSTISPTLLAQLDASLRRACMRHPHSRRLGAHRRPFGGINIIFAGDLWQLPPVRAVAMFANPYRSGYSIPEQKIFRMFWTRDEDSIQETFKLTESKRTSDKWLLAVLEADRVGVESWEMYCFTHGLPTKNPGSWNPSTDTVDCSSVVCKGLKVRWEQETLGAPRVPWADRSLLECLECKQERRRRFNVISLCQENRERLNVAPFTAAPYVHPFRYPSAHAQHLRAIGFAKEKKQRILWTTAYDKPKVAGEARFKGEKGEALKEEWLQLPVGRTSGIPGLFPLIVDLPVRFTECPDADARRKGVFKNAKGWLRGWELVPEEAQRLQAIDEPEVVLVKRPKKLFIEVLGGRKELPMVHGKRIYTLRAVPKEWSLDGHGNVAITRYGFPVVPDFAGTAHFYCGTSLDAEIGDLLPWWHTPTKDDALKAYIIRSRVKQCEKLLLTQPYSPRLFRQGVLPGPDLLDKVLTRQMEPESACKTWKRMQKEDEQEQQRKKNLKNKSQTNPLAKIHACCRQCSKEAGGKAEVWKPLSAFIIFADNIIASKVWADTLAHGQDLLCWGCQPHVSWRHRMHPLCDECQWIKVANAFSSEMQESWLERQNVRIICRSCSEDNKCLSKAVLHWCYGKKCGTMRPDYQFLEETPLAVGAGFSDVVEQLCVRCKFLEDKITVTRSDDDNTKLYECSTCHTHKNIKDMSPADQKEWLRGGRNYFKWVCFECRFPLCKQCVESGDPTKAERRPLHAVKHNARIDNAYYCMEHRYPRCSGIRCAGLEYKDRTERVNSTKNRFKAWSCAQCKAAEANANEVSEESKMCLICKEQRKGKDANRNESKCCDACDFPQCAICGIKCKEARYKGMHEKSLREIQIEPWYTQSHSHRQTDRQHRPTLQTQKTEDRDPSRHRPSSRDPQCPDL
jgi:hypothetical protein